MLSECCSSCPSVREMIMVPVSQSFSLASRRATSMCLAHRASLGTDRPSPLDHLLHRRAPNRPFTRTRATYSLIIGLRTAGASLEASTDSRHNAASATADHSTGSLSSEPKAGDKVFSDVMIAVCVMRWRAIGDVIPDVLVAARTILAAPTDVMIANSSNRWDKLL